MKDIKATEGYEDMFEDIVELGGEREVLQDDVSFKPVMDNQEIIGHLRKLINLPSQITRLELVIEISEAPRLSVDSYIEKK